MYSVKRNHGVSGFLQGSPVIRGGQKRLPELEEDDDDEASIYPFGLRAETKEVVEIADDLSAGTFKLVTKNKKFRCYLPY